MAQSAQSTPTDATQTEVGQEGGAHANFPPFDPSTFPSQLVWFAIAFGVPLLVHVEARLCRSSAR